MIATDAIGDTYDALLDRESGEGSSAPARGRRQRGGQAQHGRQNAAISGAVRR